MNSNVEFSTAIKKVLFRSKEGNALVAKLIIAKRDEGSTGFIQLGRFSNNYEGSKFMVSCNRVEAEWIVNIIPLLLKNARVSKPVKTPILLEKKDFENDRGFELSVSKFKAFKQIEIAQTFIKNDDIGVRSVSVPVGELNKISLVFKNLLTAMEIKLDAEQRLEATEQIFMSFLAHLVKVNMSKALVDPAFTVELDESLFEKINSGSAPMTYWFAAQFIAENFEDNQDLLMDIFKLLGMSSFNENRLSKAQLLQVLTNNVQQLADPNNLPLFDFTMFVIDYLATV